MKNFLKQVGATLAGLFIFSLFITGIISHGLITSLKKNIFRPAIEQSLTKHNLLHIRLEGKITEHTTLPFLPHLSFTELTYGLEKAATDPTIKGVFIETRTDFTTSYAYLEALAQLLEKFKQSDKPVAVYSEGYSLPFLANFASADILTINPVGSISLQGPYTSLLYYKQLLDKLNITPIVYQSGKNKNAGERFTNSVPRKETKQRILGLLNDLYNYSKENISRHRNINPQTIDMLNEEYAFLTPLQAKEAGIIDAIQHKADIIDKLERLIANKDQGIQDETENQAQRKSIEQTDSNSSAQKLSLIDLHTYNKLQQAKNSRLINKDKQIMILSLEGTITEGKSKPGRLGADDTVALIEEYAEESSCKALILIINSPGGSVTASEKIRHAIARTKSKKPVIALIRSVGASGGYYIIMNANYIIGQNTSIIGSIGVIAMAFEASGLFKKLGVHVETIKTTPYGDLNNLYHVPSEKERNSMQNNINYLNELFRSQVIEARKLDPKKAEAFADGRVFLAKQAKEHGLIDKIGYLSHAIEQAALLAHLKPGKYSVVYHQRPLAIRELLLHLTRLRQS